MTSISSHSNSQETPPPAWGRPAARHIDFSISRNTPTCVGKTPLHWARWTVQWKHPHLRGEDAESPSTEALLLETPPPAWGRLVIFVIMCKMRRNTPTCVGKTKVFITRSVVRQKHPHLRGEDQHHEEIRRVNVETPPPAWGRRCS